MSSLSSNTRVIIVSIEEKILSGWLSLGKKFSRYEYDAMNDSTIKYKIIKKKRDVVKSTTKYSKPTKRQI